jgi:hypothetical protein
MFDMRYHIASLVAVFLALAIGILLGTVIVDRGLLVDQQKSMVKKIESSFENLRTENRALNVEVKAQRDFAAQVMPLAVRDRLTGRNIAIIATTTVPDTVKDALIENLKKAGATASFVSVSENFKPSEATALQIKPYYPKTTQVKAENAQALMLKKMLESLASGSVSTDSTATASSTSASTTSTTVVPKTPFLLAIKDIGFIKTDIDLSAPYKAFDSAIIVGGTDASRDPLQIDMPIILQLKSTKLRTVGVETSICKHSFMQEYQSVHIPTVDNIDQSTRIISTIFTLSGIDGNFGVKKTAEQLLPTIETAE